MSSITAFFNCRPRGKGFTLIETLVAISIMVVAIVAPMQLAMLSLSSAFYARDQVTAFHLAQEAIESIRSVRDQNILLNAYGTPTDLLSGIPSTTGLPFTVDTRDNQMTLCASTCNPLTSNGKFYGYTTGSGWNTTRFTRTVRTEFVSAPDEIRISVEVKWRTGVIQERTFTIKQNLYRWVEDGAASSS